MTLISHKIKTIEREQLLDELAEIIYDQICQQTQIKSTTDSRSNLKRTETDDEK